MNKQWNLNTLVRPNIASLNPYSSARDEFKEGDREFVFLDANENPFENGVNRYPDPQQISVKTALAKQKEVNVGQILLGNGSDEVLDLLFRAFCEPNVDNVLTLPPTYGMYKVLAGINAVANREVLLTDNFELNVTSILKAQDENSKLLFICSPNNPTGNVFDKKAVETLLDTFNGLVVIDEAYIDFSETESWLENLSDYPNLVVIQTLSKAYGMAGIRLGICYASVEIIAVLNKIKPPYNVNELTQHRALERLSNTHELNNEIASILENKSKLLKQLHQVNFIKKVYPSEANFILIKVDDANKRYQQLLEEGIVVRNRSTQPLCENTLRITIGTQNESNQLLSALKNISS